MAALEERSPSLLPALLAWIAGERREAWTLILDHDGVSLSANAAGDVLDVCLCWDEVEVTTAGRAVLVAVARTTPAAVAAAAINRPLRALARFPGLGALDELPIDAVRSCDEDRSTTITLIDRLERWPG